LDLRFNMVFAKWFQRKTLMTGPCGFCIDRSVPELCAVMALGCYWALDDDRPLVRPESDLAYPHSVEYRKAMFVFQSLHKMADRSVAGKLTEVIRSVVHGLIAQYYTIKSLRMGAMSEVTWDPQVSFDETLAVGGWATGTNRDSYIWNYVISIIPPALCIAGYQDCRLIPGLPSLHCLYSDEDPDKVFPSEKMETFLSILFPTNMPCFKKQLKILLRLAAAVMIKNYEHVESNHGHEHRMVKSRLIDVTIQTGLVRSTHRHPAQREAASKLRHWSRKVQATFEESNSPERHDASTTNGTLRRRTIASQIETVNSRVASLLERNIEQQAALVEMKLKARKTEEALADLTSAVTQQSNQIQAWHSYTSTAMSNMTKMVSDMHQKMMGFQSPNKRITPPSVANPNAVSSLVSSPASAAPSAEGSNNSPAPPPSPAASPQ